MNAPLDALALQADALGAQPGPGEPEPIAAPGPPPESPNLAMIVLAFTALREALCLLLQVHSPRITLNELAIGQCAQVLAPVADKYGLDLGQQLGPEVAAGLVAGPILWNVWEQLNNELRAKKAKPLTPADVQAADDAAAAAAPAST